jgi:hypothetical protein
MSERAFVVRVVVSLLGAETCIEDGNGQFLREVLSLDPLRENMPVVVEKEPY